MSSEEEDNFMEDLHKWDTKHAKQHFLSKMERKMHRKESHPGRR
jgi:hypothetical protein